MKGRYFLRYDTSIDVRSFPDKKFRKVNFLVNYGGKQCSALVVVSGIDVRSCVQKQ